MQKSLLISLFLAWNAIVLAQQRPIYTQYILNNFVINPAVAGIESYWDIKASYRNQWAGIDGAPVTAYMTAQGPIGKEDFHSETATTVHTSDENPRGYTYWKGYTVTPAHAGIGFAIVNDRSGPLSNFSAGGTFAYHIPLAERTALSFGVSFGIQQLSLDASKLDFGGQSAVDPAVAGSGQLNRIRPDFSAGIWLYSSDGFIGLAARQIVPEQIGFNRTSDTIGVFSGKLIPHLFFQAGYRFLIGEDFNFLPSVFVRYVQPIPVGFDVNTKLQYRDLMWIGGSYRYKNGYAAMLGVNINSSINIGYSYDITTTPLNTFSYGTHELLIGFLLGNKGTDLSAKNLW
jgi:type IX secretion system PorP/SprF family membrane protein